MKPLDKKYKKRLEAIGEEIQKSEQLATYLDTEEIEDFRELQNAFEPAIDDLHTEIAENHPLQQESFELELLDPQYEGLYMPRVLGYCVLRGEIDDKYKYIKPQDHFKDILLGICHSSNFEMLKTRIGQTLKVGFALSSDIWSTNLINEIALKTVRQFLERVKDPDYRVLQHRRTAYVKFKKQFQSLNYATTTFPKTLLELELNAPSLKSFFLYRATSDYNNSNIIPSIVDFLHNKEFRQSRDFLELIMIIGMAFDLTDEEANLLTEALEDMKENYDAFEKEYFAILENLYDIPQIHVANADKRFATLVDKNWTGELSKYYDVVEIVHTKGYMHEDSIDQVRKYYHNHKGLSDQNQCVRKVIFSYFANFLLNLPPEDYPEYFNITKTIIIYIGIFDNQKFNQDVKKYSLGYIKRLIKTYTDKRGKDYQDIKKFVMTTFQDLNFMSEKELKNFFKTKRKKKTT